jgi:hypothetical protein
MFGFLELVLQELSLLLVRGATIRISPQNFTGPAGLTSLKECSG